MAKKEMIVSSEGLERLKQELEELKTVRRQEIAEKIETARAFGDLSENSEYDEAKNEQAVVEGRIVELEEQLKYVRVLDEAELNSEIVHVGSRVQVQLRGSQSVQEYKIVGPTESDPANGNISDDCPVGKGLLGHRKGDEVEITVPTGTVIYKIVGIAK